MSTQNGSPTPPETYEGAFEFTRRRVCDEDRLIGDRFSWLLSSQTIFVAAYAILLELNQPPGTGAVQYVFFFSFISHVAIGTCFVNYVSILGAVLAIYRFLKALDKKYPQYSANSQWCILGPTFTHVMGQSSPIFIPLGFLGFWIFSIFGLSAFWVSMGIGAVLLILLWLSTFPYPWNRRWW